MKPKIRASSLSAVIFAGVLASSIVNADSGSWTGATDLTWAGDNWTVLPAPGATSGTTSTDVATFSTTGSGTITVDANRNIFGINFNGNSNAFTLSGGNLLLTNGGTIQTSGAGTAHTDTISSAIEIQGDGGSAFFTGGSSTAARLLVISGGVTGVSTGSNTTTLTLNGANTGANTVSGIIGDGAGGGTLALVKSGAGVWNITNTDNSFTGGITLSGGSLSFGGNSRTLNNNKITVTANSTLQGFANSSGNTSTSGGLNVVGSGTTLSIGLPSAVWGYTQAGILEGNGTVLGQGASATGVILNFTNTGNTFTGNLNTNTGTSMIGGFNVASLGDGGQIVLGSAGTSASTFSLASNAVATTFNTRQFVLSSNSNYTANINNNASLASSTLTINTDLSVTSTGTKTLSLGGTNTGLNVFGGAIANGSGTVVVTKAGAGNWRISGDMSHTGGLNINGGSLTLSGTNSYSGNTNFGANNTVLTIAGIQAASANTTFVMNTNASSSASTLILLDDTGGVNGSSVTLSNTVTIQNANAPGNAHTFIVGNNNTANGGTSSGTTTGSTIAVATLNWNTYNTGTTAYGPINIQGTDGYRLQFNSVVLHNAANLTSNTVGQTTFNPTTANVTLGTVTVGTGNVNQGLQTLVLDGTSSDNRVTGAISNASDFATSNRALSVTKSNISTWTLSGTNAYTGTTTVSGGLLRFTGDSSAATGAVSVTGGVLGGNNGSLGGAVTVSSTGGLNLADGSVGNLTLGSTLGLTGAASANNLIFDLAQSGSSTDSVAVTGAFSMTNSGAGVVGLNQLGGSANRLTAGSYDILTAASGIDASAFRLATTRAFGQTFALSTGGAGAALTLTTTQVTADANVANTTISGANASWADTASFTSLGAAATPDYQSNVTVNSAIGTSPLNGSTNINSLTYGTGATTASTISAGTATAGTVASMLVLEAAGVNGNTAGNGITVNNTNAITHTISANVGLARSQTWTINNPNTGATGLTVSGVISDFGGGYSLTKAGTGTLTLSGTNTYSGGTILDGGTLRVSADAHLGAAGSNITVNSNSLFQSTANSITYARDILINGSSTLLSTEMGNNFMTISGNVSGAGGISLLATSTNGNGLFLNGTNNTFQGQLRIGNANNTGGSIHISVASLADSATANGNIVFFTQNAYRTQFDASRFQYTGTTALTLANRQIEFTSTAATPFFGNILATTGTGSLTVNTDLLVNTNVSQILSFNGGSIANSNTFAGKIVDNAAPLVGSVLVSNTGTTAPASGATQITLATLQGIAVGDSISGAGIADGTTITAINTGTRQVTLSNATTAAIPTNQSLTVAGAYNGTALRTLGGAWTISGENTFTGSTTVAAGVLTLGNSLALQNSALDTTNSVAGAAATGLRTTVTTLTIGGLVGNKNFAATGGVFNTASGGYGAVSALTLNPGGGMTGQTGAGITTSYAGVIADGATGMTLTKTGPGTQIFTGVNTYTGATTINAGTLALSGAGSIASSSLIQIGGSTTLDVTALTGDFTVGTTQTVSGTGTILATGKTVVANGTLSPGNSPGTLTQDGGTMQLGANGNVNMQVHNASGVAGTGYDTVNLINGATLDLSLLSVGNEFNINLWSLSGIGPDVNGNAINFDNTQNYAWTLFSTGTAITGFNANLFDINVAAFNGTTGFTNLLGGGSFSVGLGDSNTDLMLNFTAIPEPKAALLGCIGLLLLLRRRR